MLPEAAPLIRGCIDETYLNGFILTGKVVVEIRDPADIDVISDIRRRYGKDVWALIHIDNPTTLKLALRLILENPSLRVITLLERGPQGVTWGFLRRLGQNVVLGLTRETLKEILDLNPSLLGLPDELAIEAFESPALSRWAHIYTSSGNALYVIVRKGCRINDDVLFDARLIISEYVEYVELYNQIVKSPTRTNVECLRGKPPFCVLFGLHAGVIRELEIE